MMSDGESIPWSWEKSFYVLPLLGACFLTGFLWKLTKSGRGPRIVAWGWGLGWQLGFFAWMLLWFGFGGASGVPEPGVIAIAMLGWFGWSLGLYLASSTGCRGLGFTLCVLTFLALVATRTAEPHGTGLVLLNIEGALVALLPYFMARRNAAQPVVLQPLPA